MSKFFKFYNILSNFGHCKTVEQSCFKQAILLLPSNSQLALGGVLNHAALLVRLQTWRACPHALLSVIISEILGQSTVLKIIGPVLMQTSQLLYNVPPIFEGIYRSSSFIFSTWYEVIPFTMSFRLKLIFSQYLLQFRIIEHTKSRLK